MLKVGIGGEPPFQVSTTLHFLPSRVRAWASLTGHWAKDEDAPFPLNGGSLIVAYLLPSYAGGEAFAEGDQVTGVTFILTGGIAAGIGTVEGIRVVSVKPGASRSAEPSTGAVLYDPDDGRILHAHSVHTLAGGRILTPDEVEAEAFATARRVGEFPGRTAALRVAAEMFESLAVHRVDPVARQLVPVGAVNPHVPGVRVT